MNEDAENKITEDDFNTGAQNACQGVGDLNAAEQFTKIHNMWRGSVESHNDDDGIGDVDLRQMAAQRLLVYRKSWPGVLESVCVSQSSSPPTTLEVGDKEHTANAAPGELAGSPAGSVIRDDENQFLSFLAGLAATGEAATAQESTEEEDEEEDGAEEAGAEEEEEEPGEQEGEGDEEEEEGEEDEEEEEKDGTDEDEEAALGATAPISKPVAVQKPPVESARRSDRAPKPKRPQEAPGADEMAVEKKPKRPRQSGADSQAPPQAAPAAPEEKKRKMPRIRLASSSIDAANKKAAAKAAAKAAKVKRRQEQGAAPDKRPRLRLASSSVTQAYDAAAATKARLAAGQEEDSDDEDIPLFSLKNREQEKKKASRKEVLSQLRVGCAIKVKDGAKGWPGRVVRLDPLKKRVLVHFLGWNARYDRWLPARWSRIALDGTNGAPKQGESQKKGEAGGDSARPSKKAAAVSRSATVVRSVGWFDSAEPARAIRMRTATGFLNPRACHPRQLGPAGLRFDLLSGAHRLQGGGLSSVGQQLLERYQGLAALAGPQQPVGEGQAPAPAPQQAVEPLSDGVHMHLLSTAAAKTASTLLLRVGRQLVGAATFRLLHSGGEAGEAADESTLVLEVLGLAVLAEAPAAVANSLTDGNGQHPQQQRASPRQAAAAGPLAAFGTRLVNGLKAIAWAEAEQLGEPRRPARGSKGGGGGQPARRPATRRCEGAPPLPPAHPRASPLRLVLEHHD
jgi:chemotaxis protein histidine kinase CheA